MLGRLLATVAVAFALGACGSRTTLRPDDDDGTPDEDGQAGAGARTGGDGDSSGDGDGDGDGSGAGGAGRSGSGSGGYGAGNSAGNGSAGMSAGASPAGAGGSGAGGAGFGGAGSSGTGFGGASGFPFPAGQGGVSGFGMGEGGSSGMAGEILNPHGCDTPHPFVLSIDPNGTSGSVRGWLESTAGLVFEEQLPRFVRSFNPLTPVSDRAIALWWSIGSIGDNGQGSLYFYAGDFTSSPTEIAIAHGVSRVADVDVDALEFAFQTVEAKTGSILVFRNASTGETVGLRMDQIIAADPTGDALCAAVDASWLFLR